MKILTAKLLPFYAINIDYPTLSRWSVWKHTFGCLSWLYLLKEMGMQGSSKL
jgi:hypothetical protein